MTKDEIIAKVKEQDFPEGSYIVFGSCPMAAAGIRESGDIDMLVSNELLKRLKKDGWKQIIKNPNDKPLVFEDFEAHDNWNFTSFNPKLSELLSRCTVVEGIPFASLEDVKKWKTAGARPKDLKDLELIDAYLAKTKSS
jgi:hypothetical protein